MLLNNQEITEEIKEEIKNKPLFLRDSGFGFPEAVSEIGSSGELVG